MCSPVTCSKCGKVTWSGCGEHVDQVMAGVPENDRCEGHAQDSGPGSGGSGVSGTTSGGQS